MSDVKLNAWWAAPKDSVSDRIGEVVSVIKEEDSHETDHAFYSSLYQNRDLPGLEPQDLVGQQYNLGSDDVTFNVTKSMVDTVTAKIAKQKPIIKAVTSDGSWKDKRVAKRINTFVDGLANDLHMWRYTKKAFVDAAVWGMGIIKVSFNGDDIAMERVLPHHILVDSSEAFYGSPRSMHHIRYVDVDILCALYPKKAEEITEAMGRDVTKSHLVRVTESWHLRSSGKSKDGRFVRSIHGATLHDSKYEKDSFPFAFFRWPPEPQVGFWSQGLVEQLVEIQVKINEMMSNIQRSIRLTARPVVFVPKGSSIKKQHIDNSFGAIMEYSGNQAPKWSTTDAVPQAAISHLERLMSNAYRIAGVSELGASARKEPGITAGVAIRQMEDIQSERFSQVQQGYEDFIVDLCWLLLDEARDLEIEGKKDTKLSVPGLDFIKDMKLADIDLKDARFKIVVHSASSLPSTPAGRLEFIQEMISAGIIEQDRALELLDMPDIEHVRKKKGAQRRVFESLVQRMLEANPESEEELEAAYKQPQPYHDLELGIKIMIEAVLDAEDDGAPEAILQLMRDWMDDAKALIQKQQEAAAPPAPVEGIMPPGAGAPIPGGEAPLAAPPPLPQSGLMPGGGLPS